MAKKVAVLGLLALLVVIIVGIALTVYFTTKKSGEETSDKPELTFDANAKKTINPREGEDNGTQEGYAIEYAEGDDSSKFIDLTLSWTNGSGFDSVNKLIFTRYVGTTKIQADQEVTEESALADYGTGSVTFKGVDVTAGVDVKGTNIIKAYYNEVKPDNELATAELDISEEDFSYTLAGPFGDLDVKVTISSETFKLTKSVKKTYYQISHAPGRWFNVNQNSNGTIKFKFDDGTFLKFGGKDTFKLAKYKNKKMLTNTDGHVWVHNKQAWKPVGNLDKDDFRFAQCDLMGANTIMRSGDKALNPSDKLWKSPNGEWRAVYQKDDGNFVVYKENDSKNTVSAYTSSNGSFNLTLSTNGNLEFKKDAATIIKASGGDKFSTKQGLKPPFTFMVSDFGGLHVISKEGTEVMSNKNQFFGTYSNYHKTHAGDLWGFNIKQHAGKSFGLCADECDKNLYCAGFTHNHETNNCYTKSYDTRMLGVASNRGDQNADRWSNTTKNGGTKWDSDQYYQKKIDTNCYADRYSDLKAAFGDKSVNLRDHYFNHGITEGRNATCDTTQPVNSKKGYYADPDVKYYSNEFDTTKSVGWEGCKDAVKAKGFEIWGVRGANNKSNWSNTCFGYKKGAAATELEGGKGPLHHFVGCVNGKTLNSGCTQ
ncbi:hypothetical protein BpV1_201 [Bathycoccus sp. RCC1105 virus BpV1]|uniref:hypothetical protein n=1 Tax=Bathycoccus sp. RCC1105 virus BpV1 TaxID=880159 RepID=UPI0001EF441A|nr:hypothetical protein BpV1_201 [Bathycoccus sp. RCC1105 virus BpV1]ADQ91828.1 hypothetical protein BpV1_201 [Bathycoccus sp. RCC1105 virus BpV1]